MGDRDAVHYLVANAGIDPLVPQPDATYVTVANVGVLLVEEGEGAQYAYAEGVPYVGSLIDVQTDTGWLKGRTWVTNEDGEWVPAQVALWGGENWINIPDGEVTGGGSFPTPAGVPVVVGATSGNTQTTTLSLPTHVDTQPGDRLWWTSVHRNSSPAATPDGTGWTEVHRYTITGAGNNEFMVAYTKVVEEGDPTTYNLSTSAGSSSSGGKGSLVTLRNAAAPTPVASAGSLASPDVEGVLHGLLVVAWGSALESGSYTSSPEPMVDYASDNTSGGAGTKYLAAAELLGSSGPTGTRTPVHSGMGEYPAVIAAVFPML